MNFDDKSGLRRQLSFLLRAGLVVRYHTRPTHIVDTVGRHSYMVAWMCYFLTNGKPSGRLIMAALQHDTPEAVTGDLPSPVTRRFGKRAMKALEHRVLLRMGFPSYDLRLTKLERLLLKAADTLEGLLFTTHEVRGLGNTRLATVMMRYHKYAITVADQITELDIAIGERTRLLINLCGAVMDAQTLEDEEDVCL